MNITDIYKQRCSWQYGHHVVQYGNQIEKKKGSEHLCARQLLTLCEMKPQVILP